MNEQAFFWIASGQFYIDEALASAKSVGKEMPGICRVLFTPDNVRPALFDEVFRLPQPVHPLWYVNANYYLASALTELVQLGLQKVILLDTDTYMHKGTPELFELLDKFDLVGAHSPGRWTAKTIRPLPECFPEINIGVLGLSLTPIILRLFDYIYQQHILHADIYGNNDQAPLREVLYDWSGEENSDLRFYVIPPEFNCRWGFGGFARSEIRILHGRPQPPGNPMTYPEIAAVLNRDIQMRTWERGSV